MKTKDRKKLEIMKSKKEHNIVLILVWTLCQSFLLFSCQKSTVSSKLQDTVKVDTLKIKSRNINNDIIILHFPKIKTGKKKIDLKINGDLVNKFTDNEYSQLSPENALKERAKDGIVSVDFTVTYNKNGLISFFINSEACLAYCSSWTEYHTYSVHTGEYQSIDKIIDLSDDFINKISSDFALLYQEELKELALIHKENPGELDDETYKEVISIYNDCQREIEMDDFLLYPDHLQIIDNCELSHVLNNYGLSLSQDYKYDIIIDNLLKNLK